MTGRGAALVLTALAVLAGCAVAPESLLDDPVRLAPEEALRESTIDAAERWTRATCLPIQVGAESQPDAIAVYFAPAEALRRNGVDRHGATDTVSLIRVSELAPPGVVADVIAHELGHVLGAEHEDHEASVMHSPLRPGGRITAAALERVCGARSCRCFRPELERP